MPVTTVVSVASGASYRRIVDANGIRGASIYVDQGRFTADSVFGDPELIQTAFVDAYNSTDPFLVLSLSVRSRVTVWVPGTATAPLKPSSFIGGHECAINTPWVGCWGWTGKGITVLDAFSPTFFDVPESWAQYFPAGMVSLGPRGTDSPPNDGKPYMYFVSVAPCGFSVVTCPP